MWEPGLPVGPAGTGRRGSGSCCRGSSVEGRSASRGSWPVSASTARLLIPFEEFQEWEARASAAPAGGRGRTKEPGAASGPPGHPSSSSLSPIPSSWPLALRKTPKPAPRCAHGTRGTARVSGTWSGRGDLSAPTAVGLSKKDICAPCLVPRLLPWAQVAPAVLGLSLAPCFHQLPPPWPARGKPGGDPGTWAVAQS